jgi:hypothetical protein
MEPSGEATGGWSEPRRVEEARESHRAMNYDIHNQWSGPLGVWASGQKEQKKSNGRSTCNATLPVALDPHAESCMRGVEYRT